MCILFVRCRYSSELLGMFKHYLWYVSDMGRVHSMAWESCRFFFPHLKLQSSFLCVEVVLSLKVSMPHMIRLPIVWKDEIKVPPWKHSSLYRPKLWTFLWEWEFLFLFSWSQRLAQCDHQIHLISKTRWSRKSWLCPGLWDLPFIGALFQRSMLGSHLSISDWPFFLSPCRTHG